MSDDNFPTNLDLLDFFEAEPKLLDASPDVPWQYNELTFLSVIGNDQAECTISYPAIEIRWRRDGEEVLILGVEDALSMSIQSYPGGKVLVAESPHSTLRVQLRPKVHIAVRCDSR